MMEQNAPTTAPELPRGPSNWPVLAAGLLLVLTLLGRATYNDFATRPTEQFKGRYRLDLNRSDALELAQLPGIGEKRAEAIIQHRTLNGRFESTSDLTKVRGIGPITVNKVSDSVHAEREPGEPIELVRKPLVPVPTGKSGKIQLGEPPINVNQADETELMRLPGIGPAMAQRILQTRQSGRFQSVEDLRRVKGIGAKTLENLRSFVICR